MPSDNKIDPTIGVLSEDAIQKIAASELKEDPKRVKSDVKAIQEWIKKQPHLHKYARTGNVTVTTSVHEF